MKIDNDTIRYIAGLAMIKIDKEEEEKYAKSLEQILTYTEVLNKIDVENISGNPLVGDEFNKFRKDEIKEPMNREELLKNAPSDDEGMFRIPNTF